MLSSLEALDEPLEPTSTVPRVGAFQPKAKPRAKKPNSNASSNVAGKSKANFGDKKNPKPYKVTEIKPIVKENPLSPPAQTVFGSQVIHPSPFVDSSTDEKTDVGLSILTDQIEDKPVLDALETQAIFGSISALEKAVSLLSEDPQLISPSDPVEDTHVSVPSVHEPVFEETIVNSNSLQTIEEILVPVPLVQETVSTKTIPPLSTVQEEARLSIPSGTNAEDGIQPQSPVFEEATTFIDSEPKSVHSQTIVSLRPDIQSSVEGVNILEHSIDTQKISPSPSCSENPQSNESPSVLPKTTARFVVHDNDEPQSIHDTLDASFPSPESNSVGEHTVSANGSEKPQAEPRNLKRKPEVMPHCFTADVGESAEDVSETKLSISSKKHCVGGGQLQNGASKPIINLKDENGFQNLEDLENGTDCIMNLDDRSNNQSKCKREKIPVRKPSNGYVTVQEDFLDNGENSFVPNTNISPEGSGPKNSSNEKKFDQQRGWRQKLKEHNASDSSTKMPNEVLEDRENSSVQNTNSFPDTEVVLENNSEGRIINHSKHRGLKMKARKVADGSARMQQEVQVENSANELLTGNEKVKNQSKLQGMKLKARKAADGPAILQYEELDNLDDQQKHKSKKKREKVKGRMAVENPAKGIQETLSAEHVTSNVETGEFCFDTNVDTPLEARVPSDDPPDKNNSQTRPRKRKPTPLSKDVDNGSNIGTKHLEDQEPDENARGKQRQNKRKASANGKSLELSKKKFCRSTLRHRRRVEKHLLEMPEADLDPKKLKIKDLIRLAEAKEKIRNKEEAAKKLQTPEAASNFTSGPSKEPDEDERASLAPQFKIVHGEIVLDEESLVVTHRDLNTDDLTTYRRVEESTSKLNYHTYMNRTPVERWSKLETELFYKAMQQFGTDFTMIQRLFPGRTRRQVKSKFKMEERKNPLQLADVLMNRPQDHSQFEKLIEKLKISPVAAENSNPDGKVSTSIDLEDIPFENWNGAREEEDTVIQMNSTLEIPETQESEKMQEREKDSMFPEDISEIDKINATSTTREDLNEHKEASPSPEKASNEPIAKPKSLFSYQAGTSKPKSLFGYQL